MNNLQIRPFGWLAGEAQRAAGVYDPHRPRPQSGRGHLPPQGEAGGGWFVRAAGVVVE